MTILYEAYDKNKIGRLPGVLFRGKIVVIDNVSDAKKAVYYLMRQPILGIDTETRPSFKKGVVHKVALLQISTHNVCFLFRLCKMGLPSVLMELLSDRKGLKVGLSLKDDFHALHGRGDYKMGRYIDLQDYVRNFGIMDMSLQKLYANVYSRRISKSQQLTNWEAKELTEKQKYYAATDAWACIRLYERLKHLSETGDYRVVSRVDQNLLCDRVVKDVLEKVDV